MSAKHYKDGMPKVWPWLTERDMHKGGFNGPRGTHCLLGWVVIVCCNYDAIVRVTAALARAIRAESPLRDVTEWNDCSSTSKAQAAALWNRVGESLGYTRWAPKGWRP